MVLKLQKYNSDAGWMQQTCQGDGITMYETLPVVPFCLLPPLRNRPL